MLVFPLFDSWVTDGQMDGKTNGQTDRQMDGQIDKASYIQWNPSITDPPFNGPPLIKVNILGSQMIVFNVISPLFKNEPEIKVKNLQSQ